LIALIRLAQRALLAAVGGALPAVAPAQTAPQSIDQIMRASSTTDESVSMLDKIVGGSFFTSPFSSVGGVDTLLGGMLLIFNGAIFLIAVFWGTYNVLRGIVATAQDGEVLGKQMSTVWMPIRMVTGIVGIVPVFGGFNLAQVVFVLVTALGIGIANLMFKGAVSMSDGFSTLLNPILASPTATNDYKKLSYGLFATEVCKLAKEAEQSASEGAGAVVLAFDKIGNQPFAATGSTSSTDPFTLQVLPGTVVKYGTVNEPGLCGHAALLRKTDMNVGATRVLGIATGYESPAINYARIERQVRAGYVAAQGELARTVKTLATNWWAQRLAAQNGAGARSPDAPVAQLDAAARAFAISAQRATMAAAQVDGGAIQSHIKAKMESGGWITLGTWHSAFTQANSAVVDAVSTVQFDVMPPQAGAGAASSVIAEAMASFDRSVEQAQSTSTASDGNKSALDKVTQSVICQAFPAMVNDVGECSLGQMLVKAAIGGLAGGTGGGTATTGLIDPIVMFKNMGDWMMTAGSSALVAGAATWGVGRLAKEGAEAVSWIPGVGWLAGTAAKIGAETVAGAGVVLISVAGALILLGGVMAVYIPLIPFITWMGGLIQYFVIFFEGLAAMTLAALAHMDSQGEGMGQRSEPGYVFLLNMLARPGLMVLGFVAASAACIALGTLQAKMFLPAIANSQGNSVTGIASILILIVIFMIMNWVLIQGMYNMIFLLPDNVIGIIGRSGSAELGKQVEDKSYNLLLGISRSVKHDAPGVLKPMLGKGQPPGPPSGGPSITPQGGAAGGGGRAGAGGGGRNGP